EFVHHSRDGCQPELDLGRTVARAVALCADARAGARRAARPAASVRVLRKLGWRRRDHRLRAARDHRNRDAVGGGWFGWLGYRLAARIERLRAGPPRPVALPEFHLAYYDNVLRLDHAGRGGLVAPR